MNSIFNMLLQFVVTYVIIFILYYFIFVRKKTTYNKNKVPIEYYYLVSLYKLNEKKIDYKKFIYITAIINSFIIDFVYIIIINFIDKILFQILIGIILIFLLIIILYGILGKYYQKRG